MRDKSKINRQSSKSTSSKKRRNKRDIISTPPYSEFPAATSTFSGLVSKSILTIISLLGFSAVLCNNTYASSISISLSGNVNLNLIKNNTSAVFGKSTAQTATVTSDHFTGYTLTIQGADDSSKLENGDGSKYLTSIGEAISENTFRTNSDYNDKWGFLPSKYNSADNSSFQPSPLHTNATIIDVTNSPTSNSGNNYTLALGAKVTPNMSLDSYGQTFVLAATGNGYDYHIGFSDVLEPLPDDMYGNTQSNTITLPATIPTKSGYTFVGWCSERTSSDGLTCNGTTYQPGATITLDGTTGNNLELFAIWSRNAYQTFDAAFAAASKTQSGGYYQMQDMTSDICNSVAIGITGTLIDTRNDKTYEVIKYADGHCWMHENLNLVFTKTNDVIDPVIAYDFSTDTTFNYTPAHETQDTTSISWAQDTSDGARSLNIDKDKYIGGTDINTSGGTGSDSGQPYEKIGILYNWAAATAQTGAEAAAAGASGVTEVKTSICPKGWRLPANSGDYSFSVLMGSYGLPTTNKGSLTPANNYSGQLQNPLNFNRPGHYSWSSGALSGRGANGLFWSSVGYSSTDAHYLDFYSSRFYPQGGNSKGYGFSVRCVAV